MIDIYDLFRLRDIQDKPLRFNCHSCMDTGWEYGLYKLGPCSEAFCLEGQGRRVRGVCRSLEERVKEIFISEEI